MKKKKTIILAAISLITLSSFTFKEVNVKNASTTRETTYNYWCSDGSSGSFSCSFCTMGDAYEIARYKCNN